MSHPIMHRIVAKNVKVSIGIRNSLNPPKFPNQYIKLSFSFTQEYIEEDAGLRPFFEKIINADKKLFLVTNSPFHFV